MHCFAECHWRVSFLDLHALVIDSHRIESHVELQCVRIDTHVRLDIETRRIDGQTESKSMELIRAWNADALEESPNVSGTCQ